MKPIFLLIVLPFILVSNISCTNTKKDNTYDFYIKNIDTGSLLGLLSDLSNTNIVVGNELENKRLKVHSNDVDVMKLISQIVDYENLSYKKHKNILMIASKCRLDNASDVNIRKSYDRALSLNFPSGTSSGHVFELLSEFTGDQFQLHDNTKDSSIMIRVKQQNTIDIVSTVSAVEGFIVSETAQGKVSVASNKQVKACAARKLSVSHNAPDFLNNNESRECVKNTNGNLERRVCQPSENYDMNELKIIGYIENTNNLIKKAVIESPGEISLLSIGNYLGENNGYINKITREGIHITELIKEGKTYRNINRLITY